MPHCNSPASFAPFALSSLHACTTTNDHPHSIHFLHNLQSSITPHTKVLSTRFVRPADLYTSLLICDAHSLSTSTRRHSRPRRRVSQNTIKSASRATLSPLFFRSAWFIFLQACGNLGIELYTAQDGTCANTCSPRPTNHTQVHDKRKPITFVEPAAYSKDTEVCCPCAALAPFHLTTVDMGHGSDGGNLSFLRAIPGKVSSACRRVTHGY